MSIDFNSADVIRNVDTGNLDGDPRQVLKPFSNLQKCKNFGKAWKVGDQGTVFYPFRRWPDESLPSGGTFEPHMSTYFGRPVSDMKVLGTTFLRSLPRIDENGQVIGDDDLAYQFPKTAGLLINTEKEHDLAELNKKDWPVLGQIAYQTARIKVEGKYNTKENMNAKKALIGRLTVLKLTEVVYVAMGLNSGAPIFDDQRKQKTGTYIRTLSDNRLSKLRALANDINYGILVQDPGLTPVKGEVYFLEVLHNFTPAKNSKAEAGRVDPQGVVQSVTIVTRNPQPKSKLGEWLQRVPKDPDGISAHTYDMAPMPDEVLKAKLQAVIVESTSALPFLAPEDKDRLVKNAQLLDYLRIAPKENPDLNGRLTKALGHPIGGGAATITAPTVGSIMSGDTPDFNQQKADPTEMADNIGDLTGDLLAGGIGVNIGGGM